MDLSRHEENLQDTVEVTCGSLIVQAMMMTSLWWNHFKELKTKCHYTIKSFVLSVNLIWFINVFFHNVSNDDI